MVVERAVQGGLLVRVLAVAQGLGEGSHHGEHGCGMVRGRELAGQVGGDGGVVGGRAREDLGGEATAQPEGRAAVPSHLGGHLRVVRGIHHHRHGFVVLGGRPQHGGAANVDVLDGVVERDPGAGDRGLEGVEVDDDEVDGSDAVLGDGAFVLGVAAQVQQAPVDARVQRLHPAIEHLGKAGVVGQVPDRKPRVTQRPRRAARGNQLHASRGEDACEFNKTGLVGHREEGALDARHGTDGIRRCQKNSPLR